MPQELLLQVSPEIAADGALLQQYLSKQIKVGVNDIQHVTILKRSIDARQKAIKINIKSTVFFKNSLFSLISNLFSFSSAVNFFFRR